MYHEPWVACGHLDSTGNMVEIESKWALTKTRFWLDSPRLSVSTVSTTVLPHATQASERRPRLMIHHFEAVDACLDNLVNMTICSGFQVDPVALWSSNWSEICDFPNIRAIQFNGPYFSKNEVQNCI